MTEANDNSALSVEQQDTVNVERLLGRAIADRYVDLCRFASGVLELRVARPVATHASRELEGTSTAEQSSSDETGVWNGMNSTPLSKLRVMRETA